MAYLLRNTCTKNFWNRIVEIIVGGWVVSFFETQCILVTVAQQNNHMQLNSNTATAYEVKKTIEIVS